MCQLPLSDVDCDHFRSAPLQETVREPAGRRTKIEADQVPDV